MYLVVAIGNSTYVPGSGYRVIAHLYLVAVIGNSTYVPGSGYR